MAIHLDQLSRRYGKSPSEYLYAHWSVYDFDSAVSQLASWYENEVEHFDESSAVKKKREAREHHAQRVLKRLERAARKAFGEEENEDALYAGLPSLLAAGVVSIED